MERHRRTKADIEAEDRQNDYSLTTIKVCREINKTNAANMSLYRKTVRAANLEISRETRELIRSFVLDYGVNAQRIDELSLTGENGALTFNERLYGLCHVEAPPAPKGRRALRAAQEQARQQVAAMSRDGEAAA